MVLPGKIAKERRQEFAVLLRRFKGGDRTLISEIEANAASNAPAALLARQATVHDSLSSTQDGSNIDNEKNNNKRVNNVGLAELEDETTRVIKHNKLLQDTLSMTKAFRAEMMDGLDPAVLKAMETVNTFAKAGSGVRETYAVLVEHAATMRKERALDADAEVQADQIRAAGKASAEVQADQTRAAGKASAEEFLRARLRKLDEEDAAHKAMLAQKYPQEEAHPPPSAHVFFPQANPLLVTIRSVANEEGLLDELSAQEREAVLSEAGRQFAAGFRAGGGIERTVPELQCASVLAYPASERNGIVETVQGVLEARAHLVGPLTLESFKALIPRHVKKSREVASIMAEAERLAAEEILTRPDGRLLAKKNSGKVQTFANEERGLLITSMQRAIAFVTGNTTRLDSWIRVLPAPSGQPARRNNNNS